MPGKPGREVATAATAAAAMLAGVTVEGRDPNLAAALWAVGFLFAGVWLVLVILGWRGGGGEDGPGGP